MARQGLILAVRRWPGSGRLSQALALMLVLLPVLAGPLSAATAHKGFMAFAPAVSAGHADSHGDAAQGRPDCPGHGDEDRDETAPTGLMAGCFACPACPACNVAIPLALPELLPAPMARDFAPGLWPRPPAAAPSPPLEPPRA